MLVRGISCLVPGVEGYTENVRIVSIVGRQLEHSRIYGFGPLDEMRVYLSSADLMTRNMDKRVEIAWPVLNEQLRMQVVDYVKTFLSDTAKLRELKPDLTYTELRHFVLKGDTPFDSQAFMIQEAYRRHKEATVAEAQRESESPPGCCRSTRGGTGRLRRSPPLRRPCARPRQALPPLPLRPPAPTAAPTAEEAAAAEAEANAAVATSVANANRTPVSEPPAMQATTTPEEAAAAEAAANAAVATSVATAHRRSARL